jgi:hypothetical protein
MSNNIKDKFKIYNNTLDPLLWDSAGNLKPDVAKQLLTIANEFYESLEIKPLLRNVILLGSAASFNYSAKSDIDIHLVIDFKELDMENEDAHKYVNALKSVWNDKHDIHIKGKNVEVYIQDVKHITHANGIYSLLNSIWLKKPIKENTGIVDKELIKQKYNDMVYKIVNLEKSTGDNKTKIEKIKQILTDIYVMRQAGLDSAGELSTENIVFKLLRHRNFIKRLKDLKDVLYDKALSLNEAIEANLQVKKDKISDRLTRFFLWNGGQKVGKLAVNRGLYENYYVISSFIVHNKADRGRGYGSKLIKAVLADKDYADRPLIVKPEPYYDDDTTVSELMDMYKKFGFIPWKEDLNYMIYNRPLNENIKIDNINGIGAVPWNQEVNYRGFKRYMTPNEFLKLALPIYEKESIDFYINLIKKDGIASPWLEVDWNKKLKCWRTVGHEGRHRMAAVQKISPNEKIEIHVFPRGMRAKDLTDDMKNAIILKQLK